MAQRESTPEHWRKLWTKRDIQDIYPASEIVIDNLLKATDVRGKRILEVGAGSGRDSIRLAGLGAEVYVLDYVPESLQVVAEQAKAAEVELQCVQGDALDLPFEDDFFDAVFHQGLLEHFRTPRDEDLLRENFRVLKPGGLVVVDVPQTFHLYTVIKKILILLDKWFAGWEKQYTIRALRGKVLGAGFEEVHAYGEWMRPSLFYRMLRELLWKLHLGRLPLQPPRIPVLGAIRDTLRTTFQPRAWAMWTFITIGIVGRKPEA